MTAIGLAVGRVIRPSGAGKAREMEAQFSSAEIQLGCKNDPDIGERWLEVWRATRAQNTRARNALSAGYIALSVGLAFVSFEAVLVVLYAIRELGER